MKSNDFCHVFFFLAFSIKGALFVVVGVTIFTPKCQTRGSSIVKWMSYQSFIPFLLEDSGLFLQLTTVPHPFFSKKKMGILDFTFFCLLRTSKKKGGSFC